MVSTTLLRFFFVLHQVDGGDGVAPARFFQGNLKASNLGVNGLYYFIRRIDVVDDHILGSTVGEVLKLLRYLIVQPVFNYIRHSVPHSMI